jgi:hypothetical protein
VCSLSSLYRCWQAGQPGPETHTQHSTAQALVCLSLSDSDTFSALSAHQFTRPPFCYTAWLLFACATCTTEASLHIARAPARRLQAVAPARSRGSSQGRQRRAARAQRGKCKCPPSLLDDAGTLPLPKLPRPRPPTRTRRTDGEPATKRKEHALSANVAVIRGRARRRAAHLSGRGHSDVDWCTPEACTTTRRPSTGPPSARTVACHFSSKKRAHRVSTHAAVVDAGARWGRPSSNHARASSGRHEADAAALKGRPVASIRRLWIRSFERPRGLDQHWPAHRAF